MTVNISQLSGWSLLRIATVLDEAADRLERKLKDDCGLCSDEKCEKHRRFADDVAHYRYLAKLIDLDLDIMSGAAQGKLT